MAERTHLLRLRCFECDHLVGHDEMYRTPRQPPARACTKCMGLLWNEHKNANPHERESLEALAAFLRDTAERWQEDLRLAFISLFPEAGIPTEEKYATPPPGRRLRDLKIGDKVTIHGVTFEVWHYPWIRFDGWKRVAASYGAILPEA